MRSRRAVVVVAGLLLAGGCTLLPTSGPVHRVSDGSQTQEHTDARLYAPPRPLPGDSRAEVVKGFLQAMTAVPPSTSVAGSFLTDAAQERWNPNRSTIVYSSPAIDAVPGGARVQLGEAQRMDARGGWVGPVHGGLKRIDLDMVREHGEWRIANPPDAVIVPQWYIDTVYEPLNVYFFDQTARVLVPDRVYVPKKGPQASTLVRALLGGPGPSLEPVTRSAFPPGTQLGLSVPVSADGTAEVPLSPQVLSLTPSGLKRMTDQLSWTLRQVPGINRIRITVNDAPLRQPDGRRDVSVQDGDAFSPTVQGASQRLFGLRQGRLVGVHDGDVQPLGGPLGNGAVAARSVAVGLDESRAAAVAPNGRTVLAWTRGRPVRRLYDGTNVLRPAYDMFGELWLVDDAPEGARVLHRAGGRLTSVQVPGVTGTQVRAFVVSRDGSRLVAVVGDPGAVVVADLLRDRDGRLLGATRARRLRSVPDDLGQIADLTWRSPNDLAVLGRTLGTSQVAYLTLDGSPGDAEEVTPDLWQGRAVAVVGSPDPDLPLLMVLDSGRVVRLDKDGHWKTATAASGLEAPRYAG